MRIRYALLGAAAGSLLSATLVAQGQTPGVNSTIQPVFTLAYDNSTMKQTFSGSTFFTPAATPTDVCTITGSATKTVKVRRVFIGGTATAAATEFASVIKRSTADSAGNGSTMTAIPYDSQNAASTVALAEAWSSGGTTLVLGTVVGTLADLPFFVGSTTTTAPQRLDMIFGQLGQPIVLRGVAQTVAVNLLGQGGGVGTLTCTFEWTEE